MSSEKPPWAVQFSRPLDVCKPSRVENYLSMSTALLNKDENIADARLLLLLPGWCKTISKRLAQQVQAKYRADSTEFSQLVCDFGTPGQKA